MRYGVKYRLHINIDDMNMDHIYIQYIYILLRIYVYIYNMCTHTTDLLLVFRICELVCVLMTGTSCLKRTGDRTCELIFFSLLLAMPIILRFISCMDQRKCT